MRDETTTTIGIRNQRLQLHYWLARHRMMNYRPIYMLKSFRSDWYNHHHHHHQHRISTRNPIRRHPTFDAYYWNRTISCNSSFNHHPTGPKRNHRHHSLLLYYNKRIGILLVFISIIHPRDVNSSSASGMTPPPPIQIRHHGRIKKMTEVVPDDLFFWVTYIAMWNRPTPSIDVETYTK